MAFSSVFKKGIFMAHIMMNSIFSHHVSMTSSDIVIRFLLNIFKTGISINFLSFEIWTVSDYLQKQVIAYFYRK